VFPARAFSVHDAQAEAYSHTFLRRFDVGVIQESGPDALLPNLSHALLQAFKLRSDLRFHGVLQCERALRDNSSEAFLSRFCFQSRIACLVAL